MRDINLIVVHCSFTKPREGQNPRIGVQQIRKWHVEENGWRDIGYHYVIKRDGTLQLGRPLEESGAHARGYNQDSVGVCLIGGMDKRTGEAVNDYTDKQWQTLRIVVGGLKKQYGAAVLGHNDLTKSKTCPNFNVIEWWAGCEGENP